MVASGKGAGAWPIEQPLQHTQGIQRYPFARFAGFAEVNWWSIWLDIDQPGLLIGLFGQNGLSCFGHLGVLRSVTKTGEDFGGAQQVVVEVRDRYCSRVPGGATVGYNRIDAEPLNQ